MEPVHSEQAELVELLSAYSQQGWQLEKQRKLLDMEPKGAPTRNIVRRTKKQEQHRLQPHEVDRLLAAYKAGKESVKELTARFKIGPNTLTAHLRRNGVPLRNQQRSLSPTDVETASKLYANGKTLAEVGTELGFGSEAVRLALLRAGIPMRDKRGRKR